MRFLAHRMPNPQSTEEVEQWALELRDAGNYPAARAFAFQAMAVHRERHDDDAMARGYDMLAELAELEQVGHRAVELRAKASCIRNGDLC